VRLVIVLIWKGFGVAFILAKYSDTRLSQEGKYQIEATRISCLMMKRYGSFLTKEFKDSRGAWATQAVAAVLKCDKDSPLPVSAFNHAVNE
jgi:hypothetical protein